MQTTEINHEVSRVAERQSILRFFEKVRADTEIMTAPLHPEDCQLQAMPDVSPTKWHLAHTSWFFEQFLIRGFMPQYALSGVNFWDGENDYSPLFNSYYLSIDNTSDVLSSCFKRSDRGLLSRPNLAEVLSYRKRITQATAELATALMTGNNAKFWDLLLLGCHHEQQHQELILTDITYNFFANPFKPTYLERAPHVGSIDVFQDIGSWVEYAGGMTTIGAEDSLFYFDNEHPIHQTYLSPFALCDRLVTNREYLDFIAHHGYQRAEFWLSDGWDWAQRQQREHPLYWQHHHDGWQQFTLHGLAPLELNAPVCHLSFYEANAYATYRGHRLPTELEWEHAGKQHEVSGNFYSGQIQHPLTPVPASMSEKRPGWLRQLYGDVWEWTASAYTPYPGFRPMSGPVGEYNGKFMCNQLVLRGGSCLTPERHIRPSYRNFFPPDAQWQMTGVRLAKDI